MSERLETKRCIKALYKYSSFPFLSLRPAHPPSNSRPFKDFAFTPVRSPYLISYWCLIDLSSTSSCSWDKQLWSQYSLRPDQRRIPSNFLVELTVPEAEALFHFTMTAAWSVVLSQYTRVTDRQTTYYDNRWSFLWKVLLKNAQTILLVTIGLPWTLTRVDICLFPKQTGN